MSKLVTLLMLIASLNIALFVFNLIPLLPLDGGHVAGALWEGLKRRVARLRGRPDPGYVDVAKALPIAYAMSLVLIGMSVLLIYADIVNPVKLWLSRLRGAWRPRPRAPGDTGRMTVSPRYARPAPAGARAAAPDAQDQGRQGRGRR